MLDLANMEFLTLNQSDELKFRPSGCSLITAKLASYIIFESCSPLSRSSKNQSLHFQVIKSQVSFLSLGPNRPRYCRVVVKYVFPVNSPSKKGGKDVTRLINDFYFFEVYQLFHVKLTTYFRKQCTDITRIEREYDFWQQCLSGAPNDSRNHHAK
jgi:hypothetical protein